MPDRAAIPARERAREHAVISLQQSTQRWWLLGLLFTALLVGYAHRGALSVAVPFMPEEFNLSEARIGLVSSAFFWIYTFMQMPAGWLVDRFGVRRAYTLGFVLWSISATLTGFATGLASLIGLRVALGAGQAIKFPASARAVANWFSHSERGTVTAIYLTGVRLGTALVNLVGGFFLAVYSWKLFFVITGLAGLIWLIPWTGFLRRWETAEPSSRVAPTPVSKTSFIESLLLLKHRTVLGIFVGFFAYDYAWYLFVTWLPGYLVRERGFTPAEMAVYSSIPFVVMAVVILLSGLLSDWLIRFGRREKLVRKSLIVVGLAVGCMIVPAGLVADKITAVWLLTISLAGLGIASPNTWTLTQAVCEKKVVGTVSGIQNFGGNLGGILAPAVTGFIAQATGSFALALGLTGAVLVIGIFAYWFLISDDLGERKL